MNITVMPLPLSSQTGRSLLPLRKNTSIAKSIAQVFPHW
jgi:hypothetical protein